MPLPGLLTAAMTMLLVAACAGPGAERAAAPAVPAIAPMADSSPTILLDRYTGILSDPGCGGVFTELALYVDARRRQPAAYEMRETCLATHDGGRVFQHTGRWSVVDAAPGTGAASVIRLEPALQQPPQQVRLFRQAGADELRPLDAAGADLPLPVSYGLKRAASPAMGAPLVVTAADAGKPICLAVGRELLVRLPPSAPGHAWSLVMPVDGVLMARLAADAGAPTWRLLAARPGRQMLRFEYAQATPLQGPPLRVLSYPVIIH